MSNTTVPQVIYLEDNEFLRFMMCEVFKSKLKIECLSFRKVSDLQAQLNKVLQAKIAFLDINLGFGEPSGLDAYDWLLQNGFKGKIYFLTGHAKSHPLVEQAMKTGTQVLEKPIKTEILLKIMSEVIS